MRFSHEYTKCRLIYFSPDIKHDNILFRPKVLDDVVAHELIHRPSVNYSCGTELTPPVFPVTSQALPLTTDKVIREVQLEAVLADFGHCTCLDYGPFIFCKPKCCWVQLIEELIISKRLFSLRHFVPQRSFSVIDGTHRLTFGTLVASYVIPFYC